MKIWLAVTQDEYQLPIAVAGTAQELAEIMGVKRITIISSVSRGRREIRKTNRGVRRKYFCVEVENDEGEE